MDRPRNPSDAAPGATSPLFRLSATIRQKIYRHIMIAHQSTIILDKGPSSMVRKHGSGTYRVLTIDSAFLRTSQQIYREASAVLYGENFFEYSFNKRQLLKIGRDVSFGFPTNNFALIRHLKLVLQITSPDSPLKSACEFLQILATLQCSFERLVIRYKTVEEDIEYLIGEMKRHPALVKSICALTLQTEIDVGFTCWELGFDKPLSTILRDHAGAIAAEKSWVAVATEELSDSFEADASSWPGTRFLIRPKWDPAKLRPKISNPANRSITNSNAVQRNPLISRPVGIQHPILLEPSEWKELRERFRILPSWLPPKPFLD